MFTFVIFSFRCQISGKLNSHATGVRNQRCLTGFFAISNFLISFTRSSRPKKMPDTLEEPNAVRSPRPPGPGWIVGSVGKGCQDETFIVR